ncbi:MAG: RluA family pseudouridine synthase [Ruminococcaceae bacterium]|nr:RluA family pseudouridine synthase [Oscillospiraceae bacterium]
MMETLKNNITEAIAENEDIGKRADVFVSKVCDITRNAAAILIESGKVRVNDSPISKSRKVSFGDVFKIEIPQPEICEVKPENIPLDVVYEDSDVIVINKPKGMVVHPAPGHSEGTLVSALMYHCKDCLSDINGVIRPGIVHRIDRDTSGLLAVAKNNKAHLSLASQLEDHTLSRVYYCVVCGRLPEKGTVDAPIARHPSDRQKMAVVQGGRRAVTHYTAIEEFQGFTFAKMELETGRTHQIRVHMAHIGHPIIGDPVYGRPTNFQKHHPALFEGQMLHAGELTFVHPSTGERVTVTSPLPEKFEEMLRLLRNGVQ